MGTQPADGPALATKPKPSDVPVLMGFFVASTSASNIQNKSPLGKYLGMSANEIPSGWEIETET